jgi:hypothetical protein
MNLRLRNTVSQFILVAYVLAGVVLEVGHHDVHNIVLEEKLVLSSHECGAKEIHVPLDRLHECLACTQSTLRVAVEAIHIQANGVQFFCLVGPQNQAENLLLIDVIHSGKRGPPSYFA